MATRPLIGWDIFSHWNHLTEFQETEYEVRSQSRLASLCFSGPIWKPRCPYRPLIGWCVATQNVVTLQNVVMTTFWVATLVYFRFLFWNRWTEFNRIWHQFDYTQQVIWYQARFFSEDVLNIAYLFEFVIDINSPHYSNCNWGNFRMNLKKKRMV